LVSGATEPGLSVLSPGEDPRTLLAALAPALEVGREGPVRSIAVRGSGPTAGMIARLLVDQGARLAGVAERAPDAAVLVAHYAVPPGARGSWLRQDVPHLSVVYSDTAAMVGPLIRPGRGPCLTCVELHHRDRDPAWPALASQLIDRTSTAEVGVLTAEAASTAVRMLLAVLHRSDDAVEPDAIAVRIDGATGARTEHVVTRHPQCSCSGLPVSAAPQGSGSAAARRRDPAAATRTAQGASAHA
jgi:bacteriocin biosynthesis cyclodehydratase domain-containing protein